MTTDPRQQLLYIITHYGRSICDEPKRCEALLKDLCPQHKREVFLLVAALREGVAKELLKPNQLLPVESIFRLIVQKLDENLGVAEHHAQWAVESWAFTLGIKFNSIAIAPSPDKGRTKIGSPQVTTPIMPVDHAAAFKRLKRQTAKEVADKAQIEELKRWQKIGLQGEKLPISASQWAAVSDKNTLLLWAINPSKTADFPNPKESMTWDEVMAWPNYVNQYGWCGYNDWRLPTIDELQTLITKEKQGDLFICADIFTDTNEFSCSFWSSSPVANLSIEAWFFDFNDGYASYNYQYGYHYVRLVRSSQ